MKKLVFCFIILCAAFCLMGCGEEVDHFDDIENEYKESNNLLECTKTDDRIRYRVLSYQDPKTYHIVRQSLTVYHDLYLYEDPETMDVEEAFCGDYDKEKFSSCEAKRYALGTDKEKKYAKVRYTYYVDDSTEVDEESKDLLSEIQKGLEEDRYFCDIYLKTSY